MTQVKATGLPRVQDASIKDPISLLAQTFIVEGDFRVPDSPLTMRGRTLEVRRTNLHTPDNANPDAGLYSTETVIEMSEQVVVSGWIRGADLVQIDITNSTGTNAILNFSSGPNSLWTGVGSTIASENDDSRVDITGSGSILHASTIEAAGDRRSCWCLPEPPSCSSRAGSSASPGTTAVWSSAVARTSELNPAVPLSRASNSRCRAAHRCPSPSARILS
ncbi:MAG UNVERIFIED_CONTAM: hypothetical protein LVR18_22135 [Planctomycetaceae bacterium]